MDTDVKLDENSSSDQRPNLSHGLGGDERSAFLRATISDGKGGEEDIGQCGLEVLRCTYDGLLDDSGRNRPILSGTLFVETPHRRKGVGIRLLRECEGVAVRRA